MTFILIVKDTIAVCSSVLIYCLSLKLYMFAYTQHIDLMNFNRFVAIGLNCPTIK